MNRQRSNLQVATRVRRRRQPLSSKRIPDFEGESEARSNNWSASRSQLKDNLSNTTIPENSDETESVRTISIDQLQQAARGVCGCCLEPFNQEETDSTLYLSFINVCHHPFHYECIKKWAYYETTCPQCKLIFEDISQYNVTDGIQISLETFQMQFQRDATSSDASSETSLSDSDGSGSQRGVGRTSRRNTTHQRTLHSQNVCKADSARATSTRNTLSRTNPLQREQREQKRMDARKAMQRTERDLLRLPYNPFSSKPRPERTVQPTRVDSSFSAQSNGTFSFTFGVSSTSATEASSIKSSTAPIIDYMERTKIKPVMLRKRKATADPAVTSDDVNQVKTGGTSRSVLPAVSDVTDEQRGLGVSATCEEACNSVNVAPQHPVSQRRKTFLNAWSMQPTYEDDFLLTKK